MCWVASLLLVWKPQLLWISGVRKPSHDGCPHGIAWSSISDLVLKALPSRWVSGEHIRWLKADICVCDRHNLWLEAPFLCDRSLKGEITRASEEISPILRTICRRWSWIDFWNQLETLMLGKELWAGELVRIANVMYVTHHSQSSE